MEHLSVVSLLPSATEILCTLGLQKHLVGISHECDYPAEVKGLPALTRAKIDPGKRSASIDAEVRALLKEGGSLYAIDTDLLQALKPDIIFTQDQCEVCAVSLDEVTEAVSGLRDKKVTICSLKPNTLDDIWEDIRKVAKAMDVEERGEKTIQAIRHRIDPLRTCFSKRPRVACLEWLEPPMIAGGWIPEVVQIAGGEPVIVTDASKFETVSWKSLRAVDPDFVVLMPCGFSIDRTGRELTHIQQELRSIRAVQQGRCYIVDGNGYFNRPGPRIADSCEILAALIHPEKCSAFLNRYRSVIAQWPRN